MIKVKLFLIDDLFEIRPTKSYGLTNDKLLKNKGNTPVVSNLSVNNGILDYVSFEPTEEKGILTFSDTGTNATDSIFYQSNDFIGYSHVQGMYPKFNKELFTKNVALYISTSIRKAVKGLYDFSSKFNRDSVGKTYIELPIDESNQPNWKYMDEYIQSIEEKSFNQIHSQLKKLGYSSIQDIKLTQKDKELMKEHDNSKFVEFKIEDIFNIKNTSNLISNDISNFNGTYPYVTAALDNNGIQSYIDYDKSLLMEGNSIFIGGKTFTVSYQENDYFSNDSHNLWLSLKNKSLKTKYNHLYLVGSIKKSLHWKYSWDNSISSSKIKFDGLMLPVSKEDDSVPNWHLLERYMKVIEKKSLYKLIEKIELNLKSAEKVN